MLGKADWVWLSRAGLGKGIKVWNDGHDMVWYSTVEYSIMQVCIV